MPHSLRTVKLKLADSPYVLEKDLPFNIHFPVTVLHFIDILNLLKLVFIFIFIIYLTFQHVGQNGQLSFVR